MSSTTTNQVIIRFQDPGVQKRHGISNTALTLPIESKDRIRAWNWNKNIDPKE